jgi:hypothetical protein
VCRSEPHSTLAKRANTLFERATLGTTSADRECSSTLGAMGAGRM